MRIFKNVEFKSRVKLLNGKNSNVNNKKYTLRLSLSIDNS